MSSLRVVLGSSLSSAVKNGSRLGLTSNVTAPKWWLASYTLSKHFHSFHHHHSAFPGLIGSKSILDNNSRSLQNDKQRGSLYYESQWSAGFHSSSPKNRNETRIDESLNRLDTEIRRVGRIRRQEVDEILEDIKEMKKATSSQSLMIIRCCGELIPEEAPSSRTELVQQVWKTLDDLSVAMDVSHYNALLRVYLENEHKFNPTEFLQDLTSKGIEPNRVTYQRLIARFCQDGDIDGASTILQHMKEKQMPINEYVFNALVLGHGQANDMESAEGILGVMKQAGLEPNDDTYVTLMTCYAKQGDISNVHRIVKECEEKEIFLIDRDFLNVIHALAQNNHQQLIDEILPYLKKHSGFNQEATSLVFRLVNIGQEDVAFKVLKQMSPIMRQENPIASGNFFIKHLIQLSRPSEIIVKYCKALQEEGLNNIALSRACEFSLMAKKFDLAMELFEAAKQSGFPIRQHYFWPFFASAKSEKDVMYGLRCMNEMNFTPSTDTLREYIIPNMVGSKTEPIQQSLEKLSRASGTALSVVASAAMQHLLAQNELKLAADFSTQYRLRYGNSFMRRAIIDAYIRTKDADSFAKILGSSSLDGGDSNVREDVGIMLMELVVTIRSVDKKVEFLEPVLKQLMANGLGLSNSGSELLQNNLGEALTPELANSISQLTSPELIPKISITQDPSRRAQLGPLEERSTEELEQMLAEAIRKDNPTKSIKKGLLYCYCRDRNIDKFSELKAGLDKDDFVYTAGLQAMFLDLYTSVGNMEEAKKCYEELKKSLDMKIDDLKILRYATALQSSGDYDGCIDVLQNSPRDESRKPTGGGQQVTVWKLLNSVAESSPGKVKELFNVLNDRKLTPVNNVTLGPLVKAYLVNDDLDGAMQEFERCVQEYRVTPWKNELFCRFIKLEDADRLQKVMDLSTSIHGEVNSMYDLVFAFIDCGKLRQAKKILDTPGLRARNDKFEHFCQRYFQENRVADLENLIQVTKDLMDVDRNSMYFYLLQTYCKNGNTEKALSVWTTMQEENVQPSVELLIYLADFLRKNNCSVPFIVPDASEMMTTMPSSSSSSTASSSSQEDRKVSGLPKLVTEYRRCIEMNEIDRALQIKQRMESEGSGFSLNLADSSNLILRLARAERLNEATRLTDQLFDKGLHPTPRTLRFLVQRLSTAGDINALERMQDKLSSDLKRIVMLNSRLCSAYTVAGRGPEYFENVIKKTVENASEANDGTGETMETSSGVEGSPEEQEEMGNVPVAGLTNLLKKHENLLGEVEGLLEKAQGTHRRAIINTLYTYFMSKKEFDRAKEIWDNSLKSESRILFRTLTLEAKRTMDLELAKTLASHVKTSESLANRAKAVAYTCVLDILGNNGEIDEALKFLDDSLKSIQLDDYPPSMLHRLKELSQAANKPFPHQIPLSRSSQQRDGSSRRRVDSSDSD